MMSDRRGTTLFPTGSSMASKKSKEAVLKDWSQKANLKSEKVNYTSDILVESDFGIPGAITITNKHQKEFYLESITIEGFACGPVYFPSILPDQTLTGGLSTREKALPRFKGDGSRNISAESRVEKPFPLYVPRDEQFDESKQNTFSTSREGVLLKLGLQDDLIKKLRLPNLVTRLHESSQGGGLLKYDTPKILSKDRFSWLRDDEFARQALAGVNPVSIEKLKVFLPVSQLDPEIYGRQESVLKEEHILGCLNGMSVQQAIEENKLFIIDYHDIYLPFLDRINALDERKAYATRTIFFLTPSGTLKPIAFELSLPRALPGSQLKRVLTPPVDATSNWTWQLAKAHVCSNDAGSTSFHTTAMEPFILSAHRQLSAMHPIYKLLDPHMRYTLEINAIARQNLLNADGVIEQGFTRGCYCMEISAAAYKHWRFDLEGLPADLIRRVWQFQTQLQAWYAEVINVGHPDLGYENWWPTLANAEDLTAILTTIIWLASAQHAALNFDQYPYGGYIPNRPPRMCRLIPDENDPEYASFLEDPQNYFLLALPSMLQSTKYMAVVDTLSAHSPDDEYIGERQQRDTWSGDAEMVEVFYRFASEIQRIKKEIEKRNRDMSLKNRCGVGVLPYELLAPSCVTCRGIPNSVSI
ncbi:linoleate 13S-lipoxygenase 3-1, chloroplastic-like protein [Tanacetum coccineum]